MIKQLFFLSVLCTALFSACENEIPFFSEPQKPQLLMNAVLEAGKEQNEVTLSIMSENKNTLVGNGSVTVFVNGEQKEIAEAEVIWNSSNGDSMKLCRLETPFHPGDRIRLEATAEDGRYNAWAEVEMPRPIENAIQVDTCYMPLKISSYMAPCIRYRITFADRPGEKNYYRLVIREDEYYGDPADGYEPYVMEPDIINQEDIVLTDGHLTTDDDEEFGILDLTIRNKRNVFTDSRFQDNSYTLNVYTRESYSSTVLDCTIRILSITQTYYRYMRALNCLDSDNYNETLMEPVIIPQNVVGGLGFVGAFSAQQVTLRLTPH